ncbi:hypothetical protein NADFUDRAFT_82782 [Nadsonia fulvescens var. elongata DSM 6958]|uniref:C3H1-type domain-containing protein n=1 Tax=Nadsonia fulvescens var. elongata DSM 6958 TaxID=857566 RepID=A0A1E3PKV3_9ASCO|nr:hypothetical protein NADFUDRAFT_82782 [Nadsonia fulvescens var. elongata DSM 6958]
MSDNDQYFYAPPPPPPVSIIEPSPNLNGTHTKKSTERQRQPSLGSVSIPNQQKNQVKNLPSSQNDVKPYRDSSSKVSKELPAPNSGEHNLNGSETLASVITSLPPTPPATMAETTQIQPFSTSSVSENSKSNNLSRNCDPSSSSKKPNKPQPAKKSREPVPIPGTGIMLVTDDDIKLWIEQRKKNWPSRKRVEEKVQEKQLRDTERELIQKDQNTLKRQREDQSEKGSLHDSKRAKNSGDKSSKPSCKFFARNGHCRWGQKCKYRHDAASAADADSKNKSNAKDSSKVKRFEPRKFEPANKSSLYQLMVDNSMDQENTKVLDFVQFLFDKNHFQQANLEDFEY